MPLCYNFLMSDIPSQSTVSETPAESAVKPEMTQEESDRVMRRRIIWLGIAIVVIVGLLITGIVFLARAGGAVTSQVRDIFIIVMALVSIVIGVALVILMTQLAALINLLQNELRPLIKSTRETVDTLKGTAQFLSENVTEPVIKLNEYLAGIKRLLDIFRPGR